MHKFAIKTKVLWGEKKYEDLQEVIKNHLHRALFIIDCSLQNHPSIEKIKDIFVGYGFELQLIYPDLKGEPSYDDVDRFISESKSFEPTLVVGLGGGSVLDLAKAISVMLANPGKSINYRGMDKVKNPGIPLIAFPSTAGTGSEVTWTAALIDKTENRKLGINGANMEPLAGVFEPSFIISCPDHIAVSSGLDAMVHSIEAYSSKNASLVTKTLGKEAFSLIFDNLPRFTSGEKTTEVAENLLLGSYIAGIAMMNAGGGPASGISYPLGAHYNVPHGIAGGIFLSEVFKVNYEKGYDEYEAILNSINTKTTNSKNFCEEFDIFYDNVKGPTSLKNWNVTEKDIEILSQLTLDQRLENLKLNPVDFNEPDLNRVIRSVI